MYISYIYKYYGYVYVYDIYIYIYDKLYTGYCVYIVHVSVHVRKIHQGPFGGLHGLHGGGYPKGWMVDNENMPL